MSIYFFGALSFFFISLRLGATRSPIKRFFILDLPAREEDRYWAVARLH